MREKAEKRRNDYLKAKKKERIFREKSYDKDESARGFFGKLRKGKVPFKSDPNIIENDISSEKEYKKSDKIKIEEMDYQEKEYKNGSYLYKLQEELYLEEIDTLENPGW